MASKRGAPEPSEIATLKDFNAMLELSDGDKGKVVIVDLHQDWCGPALAMTPFYNSLCKLFHSVLVPY